MPFKGKPLFIYFVQIYLWNYVSSGLIKSDYQRVNNVQPTLVISLSGFRADKLEEFLAKYPESYLRKNFVDMGVKAKYMIPSFPSNIFPNHFSMMTGLYADNHGIIGDKYYDFTNKRLLLLYPNSYDRNSIYWNKSEPFWITANKQDIKTASSFWVGSEVITRETDIFLNYDSSYTFDERSIDFVNWFKKFEIQFGLFFMNEPYQTGLKFGTNSIEYMEKIAEIDEQIRSLLDKFDQEGLLNSLNIIIVSDSGLADFKRTIVFKDYLSETLINFSQTSYDVISNIRPANDSVKETVYEQLKKSPNMRVFYKEEIPDDLHYKNDPNIAPIVAICDEGYILDRNVRKHVSLNGYDNALESMRTIFLARGPSFNPKIELPPFQNVNIHSLFCFLMNINCDSTNGSLDSFKSALKTYSTSSDSITSPIFTTGLNSVTSQSATTGFNSVPSSIVTNGPAVESTSTTRTTTQPTSKPVTQASTSSAPSNAARIQRKKYFIMGVFYFIFSLLFS